MDLGAVFLTGLTVGGFSCMAIQGGLLASTIAAREEEDLKEGRRKKHNILPVGAFLIAKFIAYILLGFILGAFGGALQISDFARTVMQIVASIYMILVALNLLEVHPIFRYVVIQPPRFLMRMVRNQSKSKDLFAPALLGVMTIFIPCGTTIAMEALAISSGNPISGAVIMGAFVLGTSPLFFVLGYITTTLGDAFRAKFLKIAGILVIYLGLSSLNGAMVAIGSPITWQKIVNASPIEINFGDSTTQVSNNDLLSVKVEGGVQIADIKVYPDGYSPESIKVKVNTPVRLNLTTTGGYGCTSTFVLPEYGIRKRLPRSGSDIVEFTPTKTGKINWTCGMGMYYGTVEVI